MIGITATSADPFVIMYFYDEDSVKNAFYWVPDLREEASSIIRSNGLSHEKMLGDVRKYSNEYSAALCAENILASRDNIRSMYQDLISLRRKSDDTFCERSVAILRASLSSMEGKMEKLRGFVDNGHGREVAKVAFHVQYRGGIACVG